MEKAMEKWVVRCGRGKAQWAKVDAEDLQLHPPRVMIWKKITAYGSTHRVSKWQRLYFSLQRGRSGKEWFTISLFAMIFSDVTEHSKKNCKTVKHLNQPNKQKACRRRWINTWDLLASVWSGLTPSSQILHTPQTPRWWNVIISVHKKVKKHTVSCRIFSSTQLTKYCSSLPCFQIFLWFFVGPYLDHPS